MFCVLQYYYELSMQHQINSQLSTYISTYQSNQYILQRKLTVGQKKQIECIVTEQHVNITEDTLDDQPQPTHYVPGVGYCVLLQPSTFFFLHDDGSVEKIEKERYMSHVLPWEQGHFLPHKVVVASEVSYTNPDLNNTREILFDNCPMIITGNGYTLPPLFI